MPETLESIGLYNCMAQPFQVHKGSVGLLKGVGYFLPNVSGPVLEDGVKLTLYLYGPAFFF